MPEEKKPVSDTKKRFKLKRFIRMLEKIRGRHTELVTVYIPAGYDTNKIINHLQQEQGTAANIKDKTTRTHVIDSLERMIRHLRLYKRTPENGLAVFSGNVSEQLGKKDIGVWSIEPHVPINTRLYRCDQTFKVEILQGMLEHKETFGLIVVDRREANIGLLKGTSIVHVAEFTSGVPGKTKAGGQCMDPETVVYMADGQFLPIEDLEEGDLVRCYNFDLKLFANSRVKKVWTASKELYYEIDVGKTAKLKCSADHLIFTKEGEPMPASSLTVSEEVLGEDGYPRPIRAIKKIEKSMEMVDIEVESGNFIAEGIIVHNSAHRYERLREDAAKEFFRRVASVANKEFLGMKNLKGILVGGPGPTKEQFLREAELNQQLKDKIITVEDLGYTGEFGLNELVEKSSSALAKEAITEEKDAVQKFLKLLATQPNMVAYGKEEVEKALKFNAVSKILVSDTVDDELAEELEEKADSSGTEFQFISTDTPEGMQLKDLGGVAAFLRYPLE
ncbi:MAG: hypothetical protein ABIB71_02745 [Candidatus Woesearchaeota archaeon]